MHIHSAIRFRSHKRNSVAPMSFYFPPEHVGTGKTIRQDSQQRLEGIATGVLVSVRDHITFRCQLLSRLPAQSYDLPEGIKETMVFVVDHDVEHIEDTGFLGTDQRSFQKADSQF